MWCRVRQIRMLKPVLHMIFLNIWQQVHRGSSIGLLSTVLPSASLTNDRLPSSVGGSDVAAVDKIWSVAQTRENVVKPIFIGIIYTKCIMVLDAWGFLLRRHRHQFMLCIPISIYLPEFAFVELFADAQRNIHKCCRRRAENITSILIPDICEHFCSRSVRGKRRRLSRQIRKLSI